MIIIFNDKHHQTATTVLFLEIMINARRIQCNVVCLGHRMRLLGNTDQLVASFMIGSLVSGDHYSREVGSMRLSRHLGSCLGVRLYKRY